MGTHSRPMPDGRYVWQTERLWHLAAGLPEKWVSVESVCEFDQNCWFDAASPPTCRAVAQHARRIWKADLSFPIILSQDGRLMDGGHRLAKAWLSGQTRIRAVQFAADPPPDRILPLNPC